MDSQKVTNVGLADDGFGKIGPDWYELCRTE